MWPVANQTVYPQQMLDSIELDTPEGRIPAELVYLAAYSAASGVAPSHLRVLGYLHKSKSPIWQGPLTEHEGREYERQLPCLERAFAAALPDRLFDSLVSAPSSRPDLVDPFAQAARQRFPQAYDLTPFISREGRVRSGTGASFQEILKATRFEVPPTTVASGGCLLIVDDVFSTGRTAAVLARVLTGLLGAVSIVVACPLRTVQVEANFKSPTLDELRLLMIPQAGDKTRNTK